MITFGFGNPDSSPIVSYNGLDFSDANFGWQYGASGTSGAGNEDDDFAWPKDTSTPSIAIITVVSPGDRFNLISLKVFASSGPLTITASAYRNDADAGTVTINVLDTGNFETYELNFNNVDEVQFSAPTFDYAVDDLIVEPCPRPSAVTNAASSITATGATLNGTVNDNGTNTTASFDYGLTTGYGSNVAATPPTIAANTGSTSVSADLSGLSCNTTYHFRVKGVNDAGTTNGSDQSFTTSACVPGAPTGVSATAGNEQASVAFSAPASAGGAAITGYTATSSPSGLTGSSATSPITVSGLTNGTTYTFTVTATNSAGTGAASTSSNSVTPKASQTITFNNPGAQTFGTSPTLTATADSGLTVSFSSSTTGVCTITVGGALTFLTAGTCTIDADQAGNGSYQAASTVSRSFTVNAGVPGAPTIGTATAGNAQVAVSFSAPIYTGGAPITGYTVTSNPGGLTGSGASSPVNVSGLTNGTAYTFTVTATNSAGTGSASAASTSVTPKAPQTITFNNPGAQNFGTTPTLTATADSGLTPTFTSSTTGVCTITSGGALTFVTTGTCTINADQVGNASYLAANQVSQSFTVAAVVPGTPTIGTATAGDTLAAVTFSAPASNGGATITGYTVTSNPGGVTGTGASSPVNVTGLTNGTAYTFTVTATNSAGTGSASGASNSVTPAAPQTISFANPGARNFGTTPTLSATATSGLTVSFSSSTIEVCTITSGGALTFVTTGTCTINADQAGTGSFLPAGTVSRSFSVIAVVPGAPVIGSATAGDTQASLTFSAPASNGGATITGYTAASSPGGLTGTGASSPITVSGLTNGTAYTFTVTATNSVGTGPASAASDAVTPAPPAPIAGAVSTTVAYGSSDNLILLNLSGGEATSVAVAGAAGHGTATASGTNISYTPDAGYSGDDSFTYTASNLGGTSAPATVTITVNPDAPVANDVAATVAYGSSDTPITLDISGGVASSVTIASEAIHGTATASGTSITYTPDTGFAGADSFTYTASNAGGTSAPATITITVSPQPGLISEETVEEGESRFNDDTIANVTVISGGTVVNTGAINNLDNAGTVTGGVVGGDSVNSGILDTVTISDDGVLDNLSGTIQNGTNNGAIFGGTIAGDIANNGLISGTFTDGSEDPDYGVIIETGVVITGGTLSGAIINRGTLTDVTITAGSHIVVEPGGAFTGALALSDDTGVVTIFQIPAGIAFPAENETNVEFTFQLLREYATDHDWDIGSASANLIFQAENDLPGLPDGYILVDGLLISESGTWVGSAMPLSIPCREEYLPEDYDESDLAVLLYDPADGTWKEIAFEREDDAHLRVTTDILSAYAVALWEELDSTSGVSGGGSGGCFIGLSASDTTMKTHGLYVSLLAMLLAVSLTAAFRKGRRRRPERAKALLR